MAVETLRPQLLSTLDRYRSSIIFADWCNHALDKGGFTNTLKEATSERRDEEPSAPYSPTDIL